MPIFLRAGSKAGNNASAGEKSIRLKPARYRRQKRRQARDVAHLPADAEYRLVCLESNQEWRAQKEGYQPRYPGDYKVAYLPIRREDDSEGVIANTIGTNYRNV